MNLLSLALGGLAAGSPGSPLGTSDVSLATSLFSGQSPVTGLVSEGSNRDSSMPGLLDLTSSINALQQAAATQNGSSDSTASTAPTLPALPPMPAPAKPPDVPTDDHGQSNVVFSDADSDGTLIH